MENHSENASRLFHQGFNCAQSVFATFHDEVGLDLDTALKLSSSFGGGTGDLSFAANRTLRHQLLHSDQIHCPIQIACK
jgi:hypothetical protein